MTVIEAMIQADYRVQCGGMAFVGDIKKLLGSNADQQIIEAYKNKLVWLHATDRAHLMTDDQRKAELVQMGEQWFNCLTIR